MKKIKICISLLIIISLLGSCSDEELTMKRTPYSGSEIQTNGYYYYFYTNNSSPPIIFTEVFMLYKNGFIFWDVINDTHDLTILEQIMSQRYNSTQNFKHKWGVFHVSNNQLISERWMQSEGGWLVVDKYSYSIQNDSTLIFENGTKYHFQSFASKPDSTIAYSWIE